MQRLLTLELMLVLSLSHLLPRFKGDRGASHLVFERNAGPTNAGKKVLIDFLTCGGSKVIKNANRGAVPSFYRRTPYDNNGKRTPAYNFFSIGLAMDSVRGISEHHGLTDKWLDLWNIFSGSNKYFKVDVKAAQGTKCIAGVCRLNDPAWVMYR